MRGWAVYLVPASLLVQVGVVQALIGSAIAGIAVTATTVLSIVAPSAAAAVFALRYRG